MSTTSQGFPVSPERFPVRVLMERRSLRGNPWAQETWHALGVMVGVGQGAAIGDPAEVVRGPDSTQYLWRGLSVEFHPDEAESYYHNLMAPVPRAYVVTSGDPSAANGPLPALVTLTKLGLVRMQSISSHPTYPILERTPPNNWCTILSNGPLYGTRPSIPSGTSLSSLSCSVW